MIDNIFNLTVLTRIAFRTDALVTDASVHVPFKICLVVSIKIFGIYSYDSQLCILAIMVYNI